MTTPWDLSVNLKDVVLDFTWQSILLIAGGILLLHAVWRWIGFLRFQLAKPPHLQQ